MPSRLVRYIGEILAVHFLGEDALGWLTLVVAVLHNDLVTATVGFLGRRITVITNVISL